MIVNVPVDIPDHNERTIETKQNGITFKNWEDFLTKVSDLTHRRKVAVDVREVSDAFEDLFDQACNSGIHPAVNVCPRQNNRLTWLTF